MWPIAICTHRKLSPVSLLSPDADPLESQYSLTLVSATPKLANGMTFPPPLPLDNSSDDDYSYYYGEYTYDPYERK